MDPFLQLTIDGPIAIVTLNRPATRNAIGSKEAISCFEDTFDAINQNEALKVMVLTGAGKAFCAGGDLDGLQAMGQAAQVATTTVRDTYRRGIQRIPLAFERLEVPTIAAVNGAAVGAGCDLACMCDMRIASTEASFAESFIKLGIIPGDGGAWFLPRAVGMARACEMAFTGDTISADEALEIGLVSRVVPPHELIAVALTLARRVASNPGPALRLTKQLLRESRDARLGPALELSAAFQALAHQTSEHRAAVQAMIDRLRVHA
ncbi:MAG: crotonase/enoyl-CoA hydratase family protein [Cupriavidus necator]